MRKDRKPWWILSHRQRKFLSRKFKNKESEIQEAKEDGDWLKVIKLKSFLRRVWWGVKRYKNK